MTPAMVSGWAPKMENMNAAMKDERRTSATPYWFVVSIRSNENAMPGSTLRIFFVQKYERGLEEADFAKNMRAVAGTTR